MVALFGERNHCGACNFSKDGKWFVAGGCILRIWDVASGNLRVSLISNLDMRHVQMDSDTLVTIGKIQSFAVVFYRLPKEEPYFAAVEWKTEELLSSSANV